MEKRTDGQTIYLKDMFFAALYGWKKVLAAAVALALVLGGIKAASALRQEVPHTDAQDIQALEQYEANKAMLALRLESLQNSVAGQQAYLTDSVLMRLDPYSHYEAVLRLYIQTEDRIRPDAGGQDTDLTEAVLTAYTVALTDSTVLETVASTTGADMQYARELLTVTPQPSAGSLTVVVKAPAEEAAQAILEQLIQQAEATRSDVETSVTAHSISILEKTTQSKADTALAESQRTQINRLNELVSAMAEAQTKLDALVAPGGQLTSAPSSIKQAVVFAVLGFVLGAFLAVCMIWIGHIVSGKVSSERALTGRTGVKTIGTLGVNTKGLDRWLRKLEGRNVSDTQQQLHLLAVDIRCRAGGRSVLVTGSTPQTQRETLVRALQQAMPDVPVQDAGSILTDAAALEALPGSQAVVLVEACGVSRYASVLRQMQMIDDYNKQLLGCVVIGG